MKKALLRFCLTFLSVAALVTALGPTAEARYLHAVGTTMADGSGSPIILRGVNTGAWLTYEPFWYDGGAALADDWDQNPSADAVQPFTPVVTGMLQGAASGHTVAAIKRAFYSNFFTQADVQQIKQMGFNSIRVPIDYRLFSTAASGTTLTAAGHRVPVLNPNGVGWGYLTSLMSWCNTAHVYVILDMHIYPYGVAVDQQSLVGLESIWKAVAKKYSTQAYLGGYDLINEPGWQGWTNVGTGVPDNRTNPGLNYTYQQLINTIRSVDANHMIIAEGYMVADRMDNFFYDATNTLQTTLQISDPRHNLALSFHKYNGAMPENYQNVFGPGAATPDAGPDGSHYWWDAAPNLWMISHMKKLAALANTPLWMGEFGNNQNYWLNPAKAICENQVDTVNTAGTVVESNFNTSVGWAFWTYKKSGSGVISIAPITPNMALLNSAYWSALKTAYANTKALPVKPDYMTPEWTYSTLMAAAKRTNIRYCQTAKDIADALLRPTFNTQSVAYTPGATVPGRLLAVNYDLGANFFHGANPATTLSGAAYNSGSLGNGSWTYRQDGEYTHANPDTLDTAPPLFTVDYISPGDWLRYTVRATPGTDTLKIRYSLGASTPMVIHLQINGVNVSGPISLPGTGSYSTFATVSVPVTVKAFGSAQIEVDCDSGAAGSYIDLSWLEFAANSNPIAKGKRHL